MNKSEFRGFKQVFLFEFMTGVQKPAFKAFLGTVCALAFFVSPIMIIINNIRGADDAAQDVPQKSAIESVYIYNETGLSIDHGVLNAKEEYTDISFVTDNQAAYSDAVATLKDSPESNDLIMKLEYDEEKGFDIEIVHSGKSGISDAELQTFEENYSEFFRDEVLKNLGVSSEDYDYMSKEINIMLLKPNKDGTFSEDTGYISMDDYGLMLAGLFLVFMFINIAASNVSTSVATEKSSRVIEYLLTGTRPLALLSGKIAARLVETLITTFASYSSYFMSQVLCMFLVAGREVSSGTSSNVIAVASIWGTITLPKVIVAVLYFLGGLALYSIIGALTGASVSKLDELQDAYKLFSFILVVCVYLDMALIVMMLSSSGITGFINFCTIFPLTGAFLTPTLVIAGKLSIVTGIIALIVMIITVIAVFILSASVYESMLLFQGKRLKIKDMISLMKKQVVA